MVLLICIFGFIFFIPILFVLIKFVCFICFEKDEFWDDIIKKEKLKDGCFQEEFPKVAFDNYNLNAKLPQTHDKSLTSKESRNMIHFVFLVNGYMGLWKDLSYLTYSCKNNPILLSTNNTFTEGCNESIIVKDLRCNEGFRKTSDGIKKGGSRVAHAMIEYIRSYKKIFSSECKLPITDITISVIGYSLGGLYGRHAIAEIANILQAENPNQYEDDRIEKSTDMKIDEIPVHFNLFCSVVTPHLGLSKHLYLPFTMFGEYFISVVTRASGKDIMRLNKTIWEMATSQYYLEPLTKFRKCMLFSNLFSSDFMVPTNTSGILHPQSRYPHHRFNKPFSSHSDNENLSIESKKDESKKREKILEIGRDSILASYVTMKDVDFLKRHWKSTTEKGEKELDYYNDDLYMSACLDSVGWEKHFVDVRKQVKTPFSIEILKPDMEEYNKLLNKDTSKAIESRELASSFQTPFLYGIIPPACHRTTGACSRNRMLTLMHRGGRPFVEALVNEIIITILLHKENLYEET